MARRTRSETTEVTVDVETVEERKPRRRVRSDGESRAASVSRPELDGSIIGRPSGLSYATGREKQNVGDWGLQMLRGKHDAKQRKKT